MYRPCIRDVLSMRPFVWGSRCSCASLRDNVPALYQGCAQYAAFCVGITLLMSKSIYGAMRMVRAASSGVELGI